MEECRNDHYDGHQINEPFSCLASSVVSQPGMNHSVGKEDQISYPRVEELTRPGPEFVHDADSGFDHYGGCCFYHLVHLVFSEKVARKESLVQLDIAVEVLYFRRVGVLSTQLHVFLWRRLEPLVEMLQRLDIITLSAGRAVRFFIDVQIVLLM